MAWKFFSIGALAIVLLTGCATVPQDPLCAEKGDVAALPEIMARQDRLIHLSSPSTDAGKPVLLLLHGATDDPTEMMDIVREWRGKYDVYLYAYNYHRSVQKVAVDFDNEITRLRAENR